MTDIVIQVWSRNKSIVGAGAECKAHSVQKPVMISGILIEPGDIMFCDPQEGIARIPSKLLDEVFLYMKNHDVPEESIKEAVAGGTSVTDAFKKFR